MRPRPCIFAHLLGRTWSKWGFGQWCGVLLMISGHSPAILNVSFFRVSICPYVCDMSWLSQKLELSPDGCRLCCIDGMFTFRALIYALDGKLLSVIAPGKAILGARTLDWSSDGRLYLLHHNISPQWDPAPGTPWHACLFGCTGITLWDIGTLLVCA